MPPYLSFMISPIRFVSLRGCRFEPYSGSWLYGGGIGGPAGGCLQAFSMRSFVNEDMLLYGV